MVDQRRQIISVVGGVGAAGNCSGRRKPAMSECYACVARREMRHLLPPRQLVAAEPVREDDRGALSGHLVVQATTGPRQAADAADRNGRLFRHGCAGIPRAEAYGYSQKRERKQRCGKALAQATRNLQGWTVHWSLSASGTTSRTARRWSAGWP